MYMTSTKLNNKKAAMYVSQSIPLGVNFFIVYMPSLMFQICTDADHVNAKGLLKRGTGNTCMYTVVYFQYPLNIW